MVNIIKEITKYLNYVKNSIRSSLPEKSKIDPKYLSQIKKFAEDKLGKSNKFVSPTELIDAFKFNSKFVANEDFVSGCLFVLYVTYWLKDIYNYSTDNGSKSQILYYLKVICQRIPQIKRMKIQTFALKY